MEAGFKLKYENPKASANIFSKLFFTWMIKLFRKGLNTQLEVVDIYKTLECDQSQKLGDKIEQYWNQEVEKCKSKNYPPSLLRVFSKVFLKTYLMYGLLLLLTWLIIKPFQPVVLSIFLGLFGQPKSEENQMWLYIYGSILVGTNMMFIFLFHHCNYGQAAVGMRIRIAVSSLIYRKMLKLSKKSLSATASGQVVNLLSNDVARFDMVITMLHFLWITPFQVVIITYLIWQEVTYSALAGVISMTIFTIPLQGYLAKLTSKLRYKVARKTDDRVKLMGEIISGIQVIKMYAWEKPFEAMVKLARKSEIDLLTITSYIRGVYLSCMVFVERTCLYITVICYVLLGNNIMAQHVFSLSAFFNTLQLSMAIILPMAINFGAESLISIRRLEEFLMLEEKEESSIEEHNNMEIKITKLNASWVPDTPTLQDINLHIPPGTLCAIIGPVGAGKSSMLHLLLGELHNSSGSIKMGGTISYSSQEPWLFASTVRNNILFGQEYDRQKYRKVIKVCALEKDFRQFPQGDKTVVGERGVSLSGGQRARINLARAVYRSADIYFMDDPLSAVDTHVGKHLFEKCMMDYLNGKTRVLITHQLQYLKKADLIIVLNNGKIEAQGTFPELSNSNLDFTKMLIAADETHDKESKTIERRESTISSLSIKSEQHDEDESGNGDEEPVGVTGLNPFKEYFKAAGSVCLLILLVFVLILGQALCTGADFWVTYWTQQEAIRYANNTQSADNSARPIIGRIEVYNDNSTDSSSSYSYVPSYVPHQTRNIFDDMVDTVYHNNEEIKIIKTHTAVYIYTAIIVGAIFVTLIRSTILFKTAMSASRNLHNKIFHALLKAPMRFFDTNPSGRILNRFSKDMGSVDEILPRVMADAIQIMLVMIGILVTVSISNYYSVIALVLLGALFLKLRTWYLATAKSIKQIEGITKSPVFSHLNSTLNGMTTIRASRVEKTLIKEFDEHQDVHTSAWFLIITSIDSFGLWLDIICVIFVACVTYSFILLNQFGNVSASMVGLAISQAMILTGMLQYGIRQSADVINQLTSVERILEYTQLEKEGPFETPQGKLPEIPWPHKGQIVFEDLSLRYAPTDPPVLRNLNIVINPGEKVGIVGRTGAGKSSLISALFRLAPLEGSILIDGVNTNELGLNDLRKRISIIPQEPVLFSATLRFNLDPFNEFDDKKIWNALEEVELREAVTSLDFMVMEGGSNFSLGQRQLLCLARAILRNNNILVLDEATANVDPRTDALIQGTIRRKFASCTVLTIAHRLNTIMDSDKVLVMDTGRMIEFDHPHNLLQNPEGQFHQMLLQTGPSMTINLKDIAYDAYQKKFGDEDT